ncbi:MAG: hypothetical protein K2M12_09355 [Muribaculaceae bacterium]|nr:hypothetical protein [Muribaculaceae bacterium]
MIHILLCAVLFLAAVPEMWAQRFSVASFKVLPNDVSAFIEPVRDLNDEDCGLVKVVASGDFVFSTPLGIVKRVDNVGEIWLYLPRGSRKITIKHAEWGVLRDYVFPSRIDSHMTYELRINEPVRPVEIAVSEPVVTTVTDTLVLTRVDTLVVRPVRPPVPLRSIFMATLNYGGRAPDLMGGIRLMALRRHGAMLHLATNLNWGVADGRECGKNGEIDGHMPFYTGRTHHSVWMMNAGMAHRLSRRLTLFEGIGYCVKGVAWELAPSEGGGYVLNNHYSVHAGLSAEAGVVVSLGRVAVSAAVATLRGKDWYGSVGIGISLGK